MCNCNESEELLTHSRQKLKPTEDKRETAKETLLAFTEHTKRNCRRNWHHKTLAAMLDRVARKECRRLMVFMPPQHGKSELVSRRFPALMLGRNPDLRLIAASHTHQLAVAMNRDVQRIMDRKMMKSAGVPKIARIRRLTPYVTRRECASARIRPAAGGWSTSSMDFPLAEHDDGPDALEMCTRLPVELNRLR